MRRWAFVGSVIAVVWAVACSPGREATTPDPQSAATVPLPPPPPASARPADGNYLGGEAHLVGRFREISEPLLTLRADTPDAARRTLCREIADQLGAEVNPDALLKSAMAIADPTLSELAVSDRTARSDLIVACLEVNSSRITAGVAQVSAIDVLFKRRLGEL